MAEFTRYFSEMKMPAMPDMEALLAAHRRNMETISAANRVALEGATGVLVELELLVSHGGSP